MLLDALIDFSNPSLYAGFGIGVFLLLVFGWLLFRNKDGDGNLFERIKCDLKRFFRRGSWFLLFPAIVAAYPWFYNALIYFQTLGLHGDELARAVAEVGGKMVDPVQFYTKSWIALSNFCLINALGWGSLIVVPVLIDWAIGFYKTPQANYPTTKGFKGTFLFELTGFQRMIIFVVIWGIELMIAAHSVDSAFRMQ